MRTDVHWLEEESEILTEDILSLRRHEKDYIIRNEMSYVEKHAALVEQLKAELTLRKDISAARKETILKYLDGYQDKFTRIVALDQLIGIKDNSGLKEKLDKSITNLEARFSEIVNLTQQWAEEEFWQLTLYFGLIALALVIVGVLLSALIARRITGPLTALTTHITRFVDSNFTLESEHPVAKTNDEIGSLTENFSYLKDEVISRMKFFKQKVEERTVELADANKKLLKLSEANARFVPIEFLENLGKESIEQVNLGDQVKREMTVIFTDIRDFTKISEAMSPQETFDFLNEYLNGIVPIIKNNGGFIDKFIGDSVMALFPANADQALKTVFQFDEFIASFNKQLVEKNKQPIRIGTGIHTGKLILGTIGHARRLETTVISDAVNTASRVEGLNKYYHARIIGTENTIESLKDKSLYQHRFLDNVKVKGKSHTIPVYEFLSSGEAAKCAYLDTYNKGVQFIREQDITNASEVFSLLAKAHPEDKAVSIFAAKCKYLLKNDGLTWDELGERYDDRDQFG